MHDPNKVRCSLCAPEEGGSLIQRATVSSHLKSRAHRECAEEHARIQAERAVFIEQLRKEEHLRDTASVHLNAVHLEQEPLHKNRTIGAAEEHMWESFRLNPELSGFDAGECSEEALLRAEYDAQQQLDDFSFWDSRTAAQSLGMSTEDGEGGPADEIAEEEAFLAESLRNAGKPLQYNQFTVPSHSK